MSTQLGGGVDIIVSTRSAPLPATSPEPAAALASSKSEKLTSDIFPDLEVIKDVHVTRLILIPLSLNKIELEEFVVDDLEKSFDNNEVSYENLGETIAVIQLGELFNTFLVFCQSPQDSPPSSAARNPSCPAHSASSTDSYGSYLAHSPQGLA